MWQGGLGQEAEWRNIRARQSARLRIPLFGFCFLCCFCWFLLLTCSFELLLFASLFEVSSPLHPSPKAPVSASSSCNSLLQFLPLPALSFLNLRSQRSQPRSIIGVNTNKNFTKPGLGVGTKRHKQDPKLTSPYVELLGHIFQLATEGLISDLSRRSLLLNARLVCKTWTWDAQNLLWKKIHLTSESRGRLSCQSLEFVGEISY